MSVHANLREVDLRRFVRRKQDVVVSRVLLMCEFIGRKMSTEMIASSCCDVHCSENFFILDIPARHWQKLSPKTKFYQLPSQDRTEVSGDAGRSFVGFP